MTLILTLILTLVDFNFEFEIDFYLDIDLPFGLNVFGIISTLTYLGLFLSSNVFGKSYTVCEHAAG